MMGGGGRGREKGVREFYKAPASGTPVLVSGSWRVQPCMHADVIVRVTVSPINEMEGAAGTPH